MGHSEMTEELRCKYFQGLIIGLMGKEKYALFGRQEFRIVGDKILIYLSDRKEVYSVQVKYEGKYVDHAG